MKKLHAFTFLLVSLVAGMLLTGCVKDKCTRTYRVYTPVYSTTAEVRANIKSNTPQPIGKPGKLFVRGQYIFLNELDKGIHIIDNQNPSAPKNVAFISIPGNVDLAVKGNTLYADLYTDLITIDITNPLQAGVKKIIENAFPYRVYTNGFVADTTKIIVDWISRDTTVSEDCNGGGGWRWGGCRNCEMVLDMASFNSAAKSNSPFGVGGSMARFSIVNNSLYTVSNTDLDVYNIAAPEQPVFMNRVPMGWGIETIYPFKDKLFIGANNGMFIYDITQPEQPVKLGGFTHATACDPVIADDEHAFVTLRDGCNINTNELHILNITDLSSPQLLKSYPMTHPHRLSKDGNTLFICDGRDGLKVYDASNVNELKLYEHFTGFESYDVIAGNKLALVVAKDALRQYDYSDLNNIKLLSKIGWTK